MSTRHWTSMNRAGFALPAAVFALVIVGVLVTGGFYMANQESRIGSASSFGTRALYLAETGLAETIRTWNVQFNNNQPAWSPHVVEGGSSDGSWAVSVTRLNENLHFLEAVSSLDRGARYAGAQRRLGMTVRVITADMTPPAALTTRGNVRLVGTAQIEGSDADPDEWGGYCPSLAEDKPGLIHDGSGTVTTTGGASIGGYPPTDVDTTITDETFTQFGGMSWHDLTSMAQVRHEGGTINGTAPVVREDTGECDTREAQDRNWGDPLDPDGPCFDYFPIVHITGNASIQSGGVGQGILLVDGNLELRGNFVYYGIIIVQGAFETQGGGNRVMGGVMASNAEIDNQQYSGSSVVRNSTCAVQRAVLNNQDLTRVRPLGQRNWVDLSAIDS